MRSAHARRSLTLLVPGLAPAAEWAAAARAALLDLTAKPARRLLGRAERTSRDDSEATLEAMLCERFGVSRSAHGDWPVAALTCLADGIEPGQDWCLRADPVHLRADMARLVLFDARRLALEAEEARGLADELNAHLAGDGLRIDAAHPWRWYLRASEAPALCTTALAEVVGRHVEGSMPRGADAPRWRRLMNEAQMVLHASAVNAAREARGAVPINSVWFWGGGRLPRLARAPWAAVHASDPLAIGLARACGLPERSLPEDADAWLDGAREAGAHLALLDLRASDPQSWQHSLRALVEHWLEPLARALRRGRLDGLEVVTERTVWHCSAGALRRWWRGAPPLADIVGGGAGR